MLNIIIGAQFDEYLSTPERAIEVQAINSHSTYLNSGYLNSSLVGVQITESAVFLQHGWQVWLFRKA